MFTIKVASSYRQHAILLLTIVLHICLIVNGAPVKQNLPVPPAELFKFLRQFGYLESGPSDSESLYSEDAIIDAIQNLQKYGGLAETGELTNETLQLLIAPRCGVPDIVRARKKRFVIGGPGWKKRTLRYHIANWSPKVGTEEKLKRDMRTAFDVWAPYGRLKFLESNSSAADIIIFFGSGYHGDRYPFDGAGNILAHAFYPYDDPSYGGDVHFDSDENWKEGARNLNEGVDFLSVAIHELGHSLGLAHSYNPAAVMFPYYRGGTTGHSLEYDDIMGMYQLYLQEAVTDDLDSIVTTAESMSTDKVYYDVVTTSTEKIKRRRKTTTSRTTMTTTTTEASPTTSSDTTTNEPFPTYEGDYETVDKHKVRFSTQLLEATTFPNDANASTSVEPVSEIPNICEGFFDTVASIRGEVFIFKGAYVWRLDERFKLTLGYPIPWREMFPLPTTVVNIDAIYERETDGAIVFFTGSNYWVYNGDDFIEHSPRPLTSYGIPTTIDHIDAAMVWAKNGKTYLFSGNQFWRFNETIGTLDQGYPMYMNRWYGIPSNIDSAVTLQNGKTYFFKYNKYWLFNNYWVRPEKRYPRKASKVWLGCK